MAEHSTVNGSSRCRGGLRRCSKASRRWVSATRADTVSVGADGTLGDVRMVGHVGSTTDMASAVFFSPEQRFGVVLLLNGQSTLYELAHKPDLIGMAAFALLAGREPDGTIGLLYPAFDAAAILLLGWIARRLLRTVRRMHRGEPVTPRLFGHLWLGVIVAVRLDAIIPFELFLLVPNVLAAPWTSLGRIDLGQVLFGFALLRLATGVDPRSPQVGSSGPAGQLARRASAASRPDRLRRCAERTRPRLEPPSPRPRRSGTRGRGGGQSAPGLALAVGSDRRRPEPRRIARASVCSRHGLGIPPTSPA